MSIIVYLFSVLLIISTLGKTCDDIICADVFDDVCGMAESKDGIQIIMKYKNICYMRKRACEMASILEINQVADELCNIKKPTELMTYDPKHEFRREFDFSIVGAHQACNHSCPTFCTDIYEPACAQIWKRNMLSYTYRPMINHCHIDLFSCAAGLNVTIQPLGKCYKNPSGLLFMQQVAALKSLRLLDDDVLDGHKIPSHMTRRGGTNVPQNEEQDVLRKQLYETVRKIFQKYQNDGGQPG